MFASRTSHKRRRSSARGDSSRADVAASRAIITVAGSSKGKQKQEQEQVDVQSWAWKRLEKVIASHAINQCLQILLPASSAGEASKLLDKLPSSSKSYQARVPLCLFLDPIFITSHIKRGNLIALSRGKLDTDDVFCLDGKGVLHISVTRDTYQSLGIVGQALKQSRTSSGKGRDRLSGKVERWMIRIDILAPSFVCGKPGYDRTLARLREWDQRRSGSKTDDLASWNVLFCWNELSVSPFGEQIHFPLRHVQPESIFKVDAERQVSTLDDCWVPILSDHWTRGWKGGGRTHGRLDWESWNEELESFTEWAALTTMSADCIRTFSRSDHLNNYQVGTDDAESRYPTSMLKIQYRGFLSSDLCALIMRVVQSHLHSTKSAPSHLGFAWISCSGFQDSPLAWRMEPLHSASGRDAFLQADSESSSSSEGEDDDDDDAAFGNGSVLLDASYGRPETGPKARKRRQKKRAKRGTITRDQVGHQVKLPGSSSCSGWQVLLFASTDEEQAEYVSIENIGGCLKC